jgi:hypothetical protein
MRDFATFINMIGDLFLSNRLDNVGSQNQFHTSDSFLRYNSIPQILSYVGKNLRYGIGFGRTQMIQTMVFVFLKIVEMEAAKGESKWVVKRDLQRMEGNIS